MSQLIALEQRPISILGTIGSDILNYLRLLYGLGVSGKLIFNLNVHARKTQLIQII